MKTYTTVQAARKLGISRNTLYHWIRARKITAAKFVCANGVEFRVPFTDGEGPPQHSEVDAAELHGGSSKEESDSTREGGDEKMSACPFGNEEACNPIDRCEQERDELLTLLRKNETLPNRIFVRFEHCVQIVPGDVCKVHGVPLQSEYHRLIERLRAG